MNSKQDNDTVFDREEAPNAPIPSRPSGRLIAVLAAYDIRGFFELQMLTKEATILGRTVDADIVIPDGRVSRQHARIQRRLPAPGAPQEFWIEDCESRNGTLINGVDLKRPHLLAPGDQITIGHTSLIFTFRTEAEVNKEQASRTLSTTDALTGVLHRAAMEMNFNREFERAVRYKRPLSFLLVDVDGLKSINDQHTPEAGDAALIHCSRIILAEARLHDVVARYGRDEFGVILPETNLNGAIIMAQRLVDRIIASPLAWQGKHVPMTLSIGAAQGGGQPTDSLRALIRRAQEALNIAKTDGKNCARPYWEEDLPRNPSRG